MKRWIFENFGLKVLAVFIAFALWAYVGSRQVLDKKLTLQIEYTDIPAGMTLGSNVRTSIPVVLSGRKESLLDLDPGQLKAVVSLKNYQPGQTQMTVHPKVPDLPGGVSSNVSDIQVPLVPLANPKASSKKKQKV